MIAKFDIEYVLYPQHNRRVDTYRTDDPVAAEDFLMNLLAGGSRIAAIKHEGVALPEEQSDHMLKVAAGRLAAHLLATALDLDAAAVKHRFGFAA